MQPKNKIFAVSTQRRHANVALESERGLIMQILCVTICLNWSLIENFNLESPLAPKLNVLKKLGSMAFNVCLSLSFLTRTFGFWSRLFILIFNSLTQMWKNILKFLFWDVIKYKKSFSEWIKKWNLKWRDGNHFLRCLRNIWNFFLDILSACGWRWITFEWD